jgi:hypothetical protein
MHFQYSRIRPTIFTNRPKSIAPFSFFLSEFQAKVS